MKPERNNPTEVFENYRRQLRAFIARRVDSEAEGEDILQEVFMRFVQTDTVNPVGQVAAWLFRTARNRIIDHSRKRREERMPQMHGQDDESGFVSEITALLADEGSSPEMEGFTFRELAEDTGIPVATLLSRKHYAVKYLRSRLADIYEAFLTD